ncbi:MAG: TadE family protein [Planctomycetota bacterium]
MRSTNQNRTGATVVEFAIVSPLLFLLFFAAFEFCRVAMIRHTVDNAVYEGCRVGIIPGATSGDAEAEARTILSSIGVEKANVQVTPQQIDNETESVTVQIAVPLDENSFVPNQFVTGRSIIRELTLQREGIR